MTVGYRVDNSRISIELCPGRRLVRAGTWDVVGEVSRPWGVGSSEAWRTIAHDGKAPKRQADFGGTTPTVYMVLQICRDQDGMNVCVVA